MTTRVQAGGPGTGIARTDTAARVTPAPARPFKQVMIAGASALMHGAEAAARHLPGGPILAAAVRPGSGAEAGPGLGVGGARAEGPTGTAGDSSAVASGEPGIEDVMSRNADMNLYYLALQERISAESREYSALSNVLKARHDTVKNAIGNIR